MVYLDKNAVIAPEKLTRYLLIPLLQDDKSRYLALGGYNLDNWQQLEKDLREQILSLPAILTRQTRYGQKYEITGSLVGINGRILSIKTIWIVNSQGTFFVTLFPD